MDREDAEALLNFVLPHAQRLLAKRDAFLPFGATMASDGSIMLAQGMSDSNAAQELVDMLVLGFQQQAAKGEIRGAAICYDGNARDQQSGQRIESICVEVEHRAGESMTLFLPYRRNWLGRVSYGELFGSARSSRIFVAGASLQS